MVSLSFRLKHRLTHALEFKGVYGARLKAVRGPIVLHARRNELENPRLGLAIGRRVGNAVVRGRFKRLIRESFRHIQHDLPRWDGGCFDLVVSLHPHEPLTLPEYQKILLDLATAIAARRSRSGP